LFVALFLYSYESEFLQKLVKDKKIHEARAFNFTYRYIDDVLKRGAIRTHWYADDLLKQYPSKGDKYVIDEELQHTDHFFLGVACFTFLNFV
jgi:cystathionine beta-lyase/cystathionine gamma-synthase